MKPRFRCALVKVRRAAQDHTLFFKARRRALAAVYAPLAVTAQTARLSPADRRRDLSTGLVDHRGSDRDRRCSDEALARLVAAFQAAEADESTSCPPELRVRGVWAEWLDLHYLELRSCLRAGDVGRLRSLLENVHRDPLSSGSGGTIDDLKGWPLRDLSYRAVWSRYRDLLAEVRPDWSDVESAVVGNPHGVCTGDRLVQVDTFRYAHHATVLLGRLRATTEAATVLEIGAGMGGQAFQFLKLGADIVSRYTIIDLPEVGCLSAYCLMGAIGEDGVRLFGEGGSNHADATVEVLPHWRIAETPNNSVDLVFNAYSFSEMDGASAARYLQETERICRQYFFHVNHETRFRYHQPDGTVSVNRIGSEMVPDPNRFGLIERSPRRFVRNELRHNKAFEYLYERGSAPGRA